ncbi:MAG: hypothetical protein VKK99_03040 [Cyanobacteriota bacterium]|nr:hypothetical protein [Cyanobacteriota bacterium]
MAEHIHAIGKVEESHAPSVHHAVEMKGILRTLKKGLAAFLNRLRRFPKKSSKHLLPQHKPRFASLRPGQQHFQLHDADYLEKILSAELDSQANTTSSAEDGRG